MRRPSLTALVVVVGVLLVADFLVVNASLHELARVFVDAAILVAAGAALAAVAALGLRRSQDLWRRRGDPVGAVLVLGGMAAMLVAGLWPGSAGTGDPSVQWLLAALVIPIGASLFALLFLTTLAAARRSVIGGRRDALVMVLVAAAVLVMLMPIGGEVGGALADAAAWALAAPIGAVFRGLLIGIAILAALFAARTLLGIGATDE